MTCLYDAICRRAGLPWAPAARRTWIGVQLGAARTAGTWLYGVADGYPTGKKK